MVNSTDPASRQVYICLVTIVMCWRSKPDLCFVLLQRSISMRPPLLSLTLPPRPRVLRRRPPQTLLEHSPKGTTFYMQCRLRHLTKYTQSPICGFYGGLKRTPRSTKTTVAEPRYVAFKAQTFLRNKDK